MKLRIEYVLKKDLDRIIKDLNKLYDIKNISKPYANRPPSKNKRVYIDFDFKSN